MNAGVRKILSVALVIIVVLDIGHFRAAIYAIVTTEEQRLTFVTKYVYLINKFLYKPI